MLVRFGDYDLLSKIATGGMAEIFLAKHINSPVTSMPIAIKKILERYSGNSAFVKMFLAEARIICNIRHENIVKIYDFGRENGLYYIAMEYVFGQSLGSLVNRYESRGENLPLDIVLDISISVLNGLDHAHNTKDKNGIFLNVVHLDMNPNNILLSYKGDVKVVDFGIAHATYTKLMKTALNSIQGTFGYLSPEQCREESLDRRSDIFSFGIILYEMLSGRPLFKHLENDAVIINKILNEEIPDIREIRPDIPEELVKTVSRALEKDRSKRFPSAGEMMRELVRVRQAVVSGKGSESLTNILKKEFASHYLKMNRILERAQAEYLMDELFKDIEDVEELDLNEKIRVPEETESGEVKAEKSKTPIFAAAAMILMVLFAGGIYYYVTKLMVREERIFIFSTPPGASVIVNEVDMGKKTPAEIVLKTGSSYTIELKKGSFIGGIVFSPTGENNKVNIKLKKREDELE